MRNQNTLPSSSVPVRHMVNPMHGVSSACVCVRVRVCVSVQHEPGLLPPEPDLPRKTAEEYCAQFLTILRRVLDTHPPSLPTPQAMELLAAVAKMQR